MPLRYMYHPSLDGGSADCWSAQVAQLDVHYSSGVANHFYYLLAEGSRATPASPTCNGSVVTGIGRAAAEAIYYYALTTCFTEDTDYAGARSCSIRAAHCLADDLGMDRAAAVAAAWSAVNVSGSGDPRSCDSP